MYFYSWWECQHTELSLTGEAWLPLLDYPSSWYEPYFEGAFSAELRMLLEEWFSRVECVKPRNSLTNATAPWYVTSSYYTLMNPQDWFVHHTVHVFTVYRTYASDRFGEDSVTEMLNVLGTGEIAGNNEGILQVLGGIYDSKWRLTN